MTQLDLFGNPVAEPAPEESAPSDDFRCADFRFGGRALRVVRVYGNDAAAPVIVEELSGKITLPGQYALWSRQGVTREFERNQRTETAARPERLYE